MHSFPPSDTSEESGSADSANCVCSLLFQRRLNFVQFTEALVLGHVVPGFLGCSAEIGRRNISVADDEGYRGVKRVVA